MPLGGVGGGALVKKRYMLYVLCPGYGAPVYISAGITKDKETRPLQNLLGCYWRYNNYNCSLYNIALGA